MHAHRAIACACLCVSTRVCVRVGVGGWKWVEVGVTSMVITCFNPFRAECLQSFFFSRIERPSFHTELNSLIQ